MKKKLAYILTLILTVSMLTSMLGLNAQASEATSNEQTATIDATSTEDKSSDRHITITSTSYSSTYDIWEAGDRGSKAIKISWDSAILEISKIKLHLNGSTTVSNSGDFQVTGGDLSNDNATNYIITNITGDSVVFNSTSDNWKTANCDYASVTYTLKSSYTVTFDANGHGTAPDSQTVYEGGEVDTVGELTADGYTFGGWYKEIACTNAWDFTNDKVNADTTLYAKWTAVSSKSDDSSNESKNESNTTTETETVTPQIQGVNVNGMQLNSWADINSAMAKITSSDLSTAQAGTAASMLQINISGSTDKIIPADTINLAGQASAIKYMHVFIGDGEAVTFDTNGKRIKNYKSTDFSHKDTVNNSTKTITFKTNQKIGTSVILHTTAPVKNAKYNVYYVDANGKRTLISITQSTGAGAICFPISQTGTFVMELAK